jgi:hypothetical protein
MGDHTRSAGGSSGAPPETGGKQAVLVEMRVPRTPGAARAAGDLPGAAVADVAGFELDTSYDPVRSTPTGDTARGLLGADEEVVIVRGTIDPARIPELEAHPNVLKVWRDAPIAPFVAVEAAPSREAPAPFVSPMMGFGTCPAGTCDCLPGVAKGTLTDVARYLGADQLWAQGINGSGIVIGIVDGGITALGRPARVGESPRVPRVTGGWPTQDWGTTAGGWQNHGNMTATDALGIAPEANIYDIRVSDGATISAALAGFQWAINQHRADGTPQILSNSWGLYQSAWDPEYARDANHPFTRKVVEAIDEGILVLFAAGNCGGACPTEHCGDDVGPGRSIWGANGHPRVMTVGAVNKDEQLAGYSSQGPAALAVEKPDFCSITHFQGYFASDTGTSAATPVAAGVVALLKQAVPSLNQEQAKLALRSTAKDIGPAGWDAHSGAGIIRARAAYDLLKPTSPPPSSPSGPPRPGEWEALGGTCVSAPAAATWPGGPLQTFVLGPDHGVYRRARVGSGWTDWENLGARSVATPAAVCSGADQVHVFAIGADAAVYRKGWDGAAWSAWQSLGGTATRGVAAVSAAAGQLECFTIGVNSHLYHKRWDGAAWGRWTPLGGTCAWGPSAVAVGPDRVHVFAVGLDSGVYHRRRDGEAWSAWESLGGVSRYGVGAAAWEEGRLACFAVGVDGVLYRKTWDGAIWSRWEPLGGAWVSAPAAVASASGRVDIFVVGADGGLYHRSLER